MGRYLYHYTRPDRIRLICEQGEGLQSGRPTCSYVLDEQGEPRNAEFSEELSAEEAEHDLNFLLEDFKPSNFKQYSRDGVYLWSQPKSYSGRCTVIVDSSKLDSSKAYVANSELTDRLYDLLQMGYITPYLTEDPSQVELAKSLLERYWKSAKPYHKGATYGPEYEIVYNDVIPPDAIKAVEGCAVNNIGEQTTLTKYMTPIERANIAARRIEL